jgi:hypothetical protein
MKFWEKPLKIIFKLAARKPLQKFQANPIEKVLKNSIQMLDAQTLEELSTFVKKQQTNEGGFADRAGNCDLYYSLFGCFIAEALDIPEVIPSLKKYVKKIVQTHNPKGVYLHSAAILYAKLIGAETLPPDFKKKIYAEFSHPENQQAAYSSFLSLMTFYYLEDYVGLYHVQKGLKAFDANVEKPCPATAAQLVLRHCFGKPILKIEKQLHSFYAKNGSFKAINRAPIGDLLSTAVALYAFKFANSDIRLIKPDCLTYVDSLFSEGGFCATTLDTSPDVEYTFYGLLALGALSN